MEIILNIGFVLLGLLGLYFGGHFLIRGASALAKKLRIAPIVIGLTVVAFGTSAPELFVSLLSAVQGLDGISVGNVVGSNIINIALILGVALLLQPIRVSKSILKRDFGIMFLSYLLLALFALHFGTGADGTLSLSINGGLIDWWEGLILFSGLLIYIAALIHISRKHREEVEDLVEMDEVQEGNEQEPGWKLSLLILGGIVVLGGGAQALISGASWLAIQILGVSERFVAITIVAFGTSIPELITTIIAAGQKETDIGVGNIIGSNIFNILSVIGLTAIFSPIEISDSRFGIDFAIMTGISVLLLLFGFSKKIPRWAGVLFLIVYIAYFILLLGTAGNL